MSHKQKELLTLDGEWRKHLKPEGKRRFWKGERSAGKNAMRRWSACVIKGIVFLSINTGRPLLLPTPIRDLLPRRCDAG